MGFSVSSLVSSVKSYTSNKINQSNIRLTDFNSIKGAATDALEQAKNIYATKDNSHQLLTLARKSMITNATKSQINDSRKLKYRDYRARLGIDSIYSDFYAENNYRMLGASDARVATKDDFGFLRVLTETGGLVFPYTPTIQISQNVNYEKQQTLQSNYNMNNWKGTPTPDINVSGKFTAANQAEAYYMLAVINFLRAMVKGDTGLKSINNYQIDKSSGRVKNNMVRGVPGAPPPILYFSAYGECMFNELPVLIQSYSYTLKDDVDYIEIMINPKTWVLEKYESERSKDTLCCRVPMELELSLSLIIQPNPAKMRKEFNLTDFKNGQLFKVGKSGWTF